MGFKTIRTIDRPQESTKRFREIEEPVQQNSEDLIDSLRADSAGKMLKENFFAAGEAVRTEGIVPVARGVNLAAFGLLKPFLKERSPALQEFLFEGEQESIEGKVLNSISQARGLLSGGAAGLSRRASKFIGGDGLLRSFGRGVIGGGTFGATQKPEVRVIPEDGDALLLKNRAAQAASGVILGGLLNSVGNVASKTLKNIRLNLGFDNKIKKMKLSIDEDIMRLKEQLKSEVRSGAGSASLGAQRRLTKLFKDNSKIYGKALDEIADGQKVPITRQDVLGAARQAKQEATEGFITQGKGIDALDDVITKYESGVVKGAKGTFSGKPPSNQEIPLQTVLKDIKAINNKLSAGTRAGRSGFGEDEIPIAIFQKNMGDKISSTVPEFKELQRSYAPILQAKVKANTVFKPFKGEFETKSGTSFIEKAAKGELEAGEQRFLNVLKKGNDKFKGVGELEETARQSFLKISKQIDELGLKKVELEEILNNRESLSEILKGAGIGAGSVLALGGLNKISEAIRSSFR